MKSARRGFTLIELLVVMAILAVVAAGVVVAINPGKRINQANDSKTQNDIGQIATALQAYFTDSQSFPTALSALVTNGDLKQIPTPAAGGSYEYEITPTGCTGAIGSGQTACTDVAVSEPLLDPNTAGNLWCWESATGQAGELTDANCGF